MPPVLSIVVPVYNEEEVLPVVINSLPGLLRDMAGRGIIHQDSYLLFVDDGSADKSWSILRDSFQSDPMVRSLKLSRNFGHNNALLAGLMTVKDRCDVAISIDCDLQQDPAAIPLFIDKYRAGADVVFGVRNDRKTDGLFKKYTALGFYNLMQMMGVKLHVNHADYRLLSRKALNVLAEYQEPNIFLRAVCVDMGLRNEVVYFDVAEREHGTSKYSLAKMLKFAVGGITSFSALPLRMISMLGVLVFGLSVLMAAYVLIEAVFVGDAVPGWASTVLPIYLLGGLQILCMGVVGEYLAQVYTAVKGRPRYIVETELF